MVLVLAHYYPNYIIVDGKPSGWWAGTQQSYYSTQRTTRCHKFIDLPIIGYYDVRDKEVVRWQIETAYRYGIDGFIPSVWTIDTTAWEYDALTQFLQRFEELRDEGNTAAQEFVMAMMIEGAGKDAATIQSMVDWVWNNYASKDWYLLDPETGKPVLFIYRPEGKVSITNPGFEIYWYKSLEGDDFHYNTRTVIADRSPLLASGIMCISFRMPMRPASTYSWIVYGHPLLFNLKRIERALASIIILQPKIVNIVSWNEWFETAIEPGVMYGFLWLEVIAKYVGRR